MPYEAEVYDNRRIDRAEEYGLVAKWHARFVGGVNTFSDRETTGFRREPDTAWPPPSHEHTAIPPQRELDLLKVALRGSARALTREQRAVARANGGHDPARRLFAEPLPTLLLANSHRRSAPM